jgi:hypothetical protein
MVTTLATHCAIGPRRKYVHVAQNRTEGAILRLLRRSSGIVPDADSLRSLANIVT